jgi:malate synthase
MNRAPEGFDLARDISEAFREFYAPLHRRFTSRQQALAARRLARLAEAHHGQLPGHLPPSDATTSNWRITLPAWCQDQRNQMTGPADDGELVVKMLNSGAPGVMLDLEDSMANAWPNLMLGIQNIHAALSGKLTYEDRKRGHTVGIEPSATVIWSRVRGLHISQAGIYPGEDLTSASLFDLAMLLWPLHLEDLKHPPCIYIPKTESADEALWWAEAFHAIERFKHWPDGTSNAWRWSSRIRSPSRWRSFSSICATTSSGSISAAGITWRASSISRSPIQRGCCPTATPFRTTCRSSRPCAISWRTSVTVAVR